MEQKGNNNMAAEIIVLIILCVEIVKLFKAGPLLYFIIDRHIKKRQAEKLKLLPVLK
jgi:hypothetical protein